MSHTLATMTTYFYTSTSTITDITCFSWLAVKLIMLIKQVSMKSKQVLLARNECFHITHQIV